MNDVPSVGRGVKRIGGIFLAAAAIFLGVCFAGPSVVPLMAIPLVIFGATGVGLLVGSRAASIAAQVLLLVCMIAGPVGLVGALASTGAAALDGGRLLAIGNAIFTTALWAWICFRGHQVLRGKGLRAAVFTSRLTGVALAAIAANHLYEAALMGGSASGLASSGSFAFRIGLEGTALYGFAGWPLWHVALLFTAAVFLAAPRPRLIKAAGALAGLFAVVLPLSLGALSGLSEGELAVVAPVLVMMLLPVLLAWWLREELIGPVPARLPASPPAAPPAGAS